MRRRWNSMRARLGLAWLAALASLTAVYAGEDAPWLDPAYTVRYEVRVAFPTQAGRVGLAPDPNLASLYLPPTQPLQASLRENQRPMPEALLVTTAEGAVLPLFVRWVEGGNELEIAFPVASGQERFFVYLGAGETAPSQRSPRLFQPVALQVRQRSLNTGEPRDGQAYPLSSWLRDPPRGADTKTRNLQDPEAPDPELLSPAYGAVYEGFLRAPVAGVYRFALGTWGAARLEINGEVLAEDTRGDLEREPFALSGAVELAAGMHRVAVAYASDGALGGIRLYWQPPGQDGYSVVPPQGFPRALPAVLVAQQTLLKERPQPAPGLIHVENLGQMRSGTHRGLDQAPEWLWLWVQGQDGGQALTATWEGLPEAVRLPAAGAFLRARWRGRAAGERGRLGHAHRPFSSFGGGRALSLGTLWRAEPFGLAALPVP
jgi:hypothetical protein